MAVEKLSDGIRRFAVDAVKLERMLRVRARGYGWEGPGRGGGGQRTSSHCPSLGTNVQRGERKIAWHLRLDHRYAADFELGPNCTYALRRILDFFTNRSGD